MVDVLRPRTENVSQSPTSHAALVSSCWCHLDLPMSVFQFLYLVSLSSQALKSSDTPSGSVGGQLIDLVSGEVTARDCETGARAPQSVQYGSWGQHGAGRDSTSAQRRGEESSTICWLGTTSRLQPEVAVLEPVSQSPLSAFLHSDSQPNSSLILPSSRGWPGLPLLSLPEKWTMPGCARQPRIGCLFSQSEILLWKISN